MQTKPAEKQENFTEMYTIRRLKYESNACNKKNYATKTSNFAKKNCKIALGNWVLALTH